AGASVGIRPEQPGGVDLQRYPDAKEGSVVLPGARCFVLCRGREEERCENERGRAADERQDKSICPEGVNQVCKKRSRSKKKAASSPEARRERIGDAGRSKQKHHGEERGEDGQRSSEAAAAVAKPRSIERSAEAERGPEAD